MEIHQFNEGTKLEVAPEVLEMTSNSFLKQLNCESTDEEGGGSRFHIIALFSAVGLNYNNKKGKKFSNTGFDPTSFICMSESLSVHKQGYHGKCFPNFKSLPTFQSCLQVSAKAFPPSRNPHLILQNTCSFQLL